MQHIETIELGSSQSSITFSSIPQDYDDLVVLHHCRRTSAVVDGDLFMTANATSNVYDTVRLGGTGSSAFSDSQTNSVMRVGVVPGANATANTFSNGLVYISNYTSSANKSVSIDSVMENNATASLQLLTANLIKITSALTTLEFTGSFDTGSTISLYGVTAGGYGTVTTS